jgi:hypothetical protein
VAAAVVILGGMLAATAGPAAAAPSGTITGHVTDDHGQPVEGLCVTTDGGPGTTTDANGDYRIETLDDGSYTVQFNCAGDLRYLRQWYAGASDQQSATPVVIAGGQTASGVDAQLVAAATISGTVTGTGGAPLAQICVNAQRPSDNGWQWLGGATTGPDGTYTMGQLPAGEARVQFFDCNATGNYVEQWFDHKPSFDDATPIMLTEGGARTGVDAQLEAGGGVSGTVTGPGGTGVENICVNAVVDDNGVAYASTASDGSYTMHGIPAGAITVVFVDCNHVGPFADQWWDHVADQADATPVTVQSGATVSGIDAHLAVAAAISGHVHDAGGAPLENICVAAYGDASVGGGSRTDRDGAYTLVLRGAGSYAVQFVDCSGSPSHAAEWWDDQPTEATAQRVTVAAATTVSGIDAVLAAGGPGSMTGHVTNLAGVGMSTACVIAYVPDVGAAVAPIASDGSYTLANLAAGSYFVAFFDCSEGGAVVDPVTGAATYLSVWAPNQPVVIEGPRGPDPVAVGAELVTVGSGQAVTLDHCFGCDAIVITSATAGDGQVAISFSTPALIPTQPDRSTPADAGVTDRRGPFAFLAGASAGAGAPDAARDPAPPATFAFTATCTSTDGGATGTAGGSASTLTVTGLTNGSTYSCAVTAADDSTTVASSAAANVTLDGATPAAPTAAAAGTETAATVARSGLATTGATGSGPLTRFALALCALGAVLTVAGRRRSLSR